MATVEEMNKNLTWYQLNSNYKDPMYLYMYTMYTTALLKNAPPKSHYNTYDSIAIDINQVPKYGKYECFAPGKNDSYVDGWISCMIFQLPFFLEKIHMGYIGFALVIPIMIISIFGGIKESYRWFILNQAIWDLFVCYDFICASPTMLGWFTEDYLNGKNACFYFLDLSPNKFIVALGGGFRDFLRNAQFVPVFLLAFSRFTAMYFPHFYRNFTKRFWKILVFIFVFNAVFIFLLSFRRIGQYLGQQSILDGYADCYNTLCPSNLTANQCFQTNQAYFQCRNRVIVGAGSFLTGFLNIFMRDYVYNGIPPLMFLLSNICAGLLFWKIISQIKFQLKTNPESFKQTLKISSVVAFQCFFMSIIFVVTSIQKYLHMQINNTFPDWRIYEALPAWLFLLQYIPTTVSLNMIRVILDSIIVLVVLSGYSSCVVKTFKFVYLCFTAPKEARKMFKASFNIPDTSITILSNQKHFRK